MTDKQNAPVIVTFRQIENALTGEEAVGNLNEVAERDDEISPVEKAAIKAAMGRILRDLEEAEKTAGAAVLTTAHNAAASRLQSLIASGEHADLTFEALPTGGYEAKFDTGDWSGWASVVWQKIKHRSPHPMVRPKKAVAETMPEEARVAVMGDWGTGLYGAPHIANAIENDPDPIAYILHLGDVYYSGTEEETRRRMLGPWPVRADAVNRAVNSNHEMYSGGVSYFTDTLPEFDQDGSYFAAQNKHWTLIGLDVAYKDHDIDDIQVDWLRQILAAAGERRIILFSHHQLYSHWESQGKKLWSHPGFGELLSRKKIFAWYWGHEHRCSIFEEPDSKFGILARCIGHGGMPQSRSATRHLPLADGKLFERATWRRAEAAEFAGNRLSSVVVLDGPNEFIPGEEDLFSPHGYAMLHFDGPRLTEQVRDPKGTVIYENVIAE